MSAAAVVWLVRAEMAEVGQRGSQPVVDGPSGWHSESESATPGETVTVAFGGGWNRRTLSMKIIRWCSAILERRPACRGRSTPTARWIGHRLRALGVAASERDAGMRSRGCGAIMAIPRKAMWSGSLVVVF